MKKQSTARYILQLALTHQQKSAVRLLLCNLSIDVQQLTVVLLGIKATHMTHQHRAVRNSKFLPDGLSAIRVKVEDAKIHRIVEDADLSAFVGSLTEGVLGSQIRRRELYIHIAVVKQPSQPVGKPGLPAFAVATVAGTGSAKGSTCRISR